MAKKWAMLKTLFLIGIFSVLFISCNAPSTGSQEPMLDLLQLDQGETYISISKTDDSGYNRGIPFYFVLYSHESEETITEALDSEIASAALSDIHGEVVLETKELMWTAFKVDDTKCNLALVIMLNEGELSQQEIYDIAKISFSACETNRKKPFDLKPCTIQSFETAPGEQYYTTQVPIDIHFSRDDGKGELRYRILRGDDEKDVISISLEYPEHFASIRDVTIRPDLWELQDMPLEENEKSFEVSLRFQVPEDSLAFRPAIKLHLEQEETVYIIPTLPSYITFESVQ